MTSPRRVFDAAEIMEAGIHLDGIHFYALAAEVDESVEAGTSMSSEVTPDQSLLVRNEGTELGVRLATVIDVGIGVVRVDAAVEYHAEEELELDEAARLDFANRIGIMALFPYVRQAIADLTQRVFGQPVVIPMIPLGGLVFTADDAVRPVETDDAASAPDDA